MGAHDYQEWTFEDDVVIGHTRATDSAQSRRGPVGTGRLDSSAPFELDFFPVTYPVGFDPEAPRDEHLRSPFLEFEDGFLYPRNQGADLHHAIDLLGPIGMPIVATKSGRVVTEWRYQGRVRPGANESAATASGHGGNFIRMLDFAGYVHYYAHLRDFPLVGPGDRVTAGQILGYLGRSGTTIPHLHYQVRGPQRVTGRMRTARGACEHLVGSTIDTEETEPPCYSTRGGNAVNPFSELVRLCRELGGESIGRGTRHRLNP